MGIDIGIEVEGEEDLYDTGIDTLDSRAFADIVSDITESEDTLTNTLASKYGFSLEPLGKISGEENSEIGPWQDPLEAWESAYGLFDAFAKEGTILIGEEISYRPLDVQNIPYYMQTLSAAVTLFKYAHEKKKRVRLYFC